MCKEGCVDGIYSNLNYTRNRMLNTRMKKISCHIFRFWNGHVTINSRKEVLLLCPPSVRYSHYYIPFALYCNILDVNILATYGSYYPLYSATISDTIIDEIWTGKQFYWALLSTTRDYSLQSSFTYKLVSTVMFSLSLLVSGFQESNCRRSLSSGFPNCHFASTTKTPTASLP
jgi:hypothetical protein